MRYWPASHNDSGSPVRPSRLAGGCRSGCNVAAGRDLLHPRVARDHVRVPRPRPGATVLLVATAPERAGIDAAPALFRGAAVPAAAVASAVKQSAAQRARGIARNARARSRPYAIPGAPRDAAGRAVSAGWEAGRCNPATNFLETGTLL